MLLYGQDERQRENPRFSPSCRSHRKCPTDPRGEPQHLASTECSPGPAPPIVLAASGLLRPDLPDHDVVWQKVQPGSCRSQIVRVRSGLAIEPVPAGDQAFEYQRQLALRRGEDLPGSRSVYPAAFHSPVLIVPPAEMLRRNLIHAIFSSGPACIPGLIGSRPQQLRPR
jgi:hypothetical protein